MRTVSLCLALAAATALAAPALATTTYRILYAGSDMIQSTPLIRDEVWQLGPGISFTGRGFAYPGHVGLFDRMDIDWTGGGGSYLECTLVAETNEFVISGPPGPPVTGTLHFRYQVNFARGAGYPDNNAHGGGTQIYAMANNIWVTGDYWVGNVSTSHASGLFAGLSGSSIGLPFSITGSFPVGTPFSVRVQLFGRAQTYGNLSTGNPGFSEINAGNHGAGAVAGGLRLEEVSGQVMSLPPGYTVNCPSWGVVDNHYQSTVAVEPAPANADLALSLHPNPAAADVSVELTLPRAGDARVDIFDAAGRRVSRLAEGWLSAGRHLVRWDGRAESGEGAPAGIYFVRAEAAGQVVLQRVVRLE